MRLVVSVAMDGDAFTARHKVRCAGLVAHVASLLAMGDSMTEVNAALIRTGSRGVVVTLEGEE